MRVTGAVGSDFDAQSRRTQQGVPAPQPHHSLIPAPTGGSDTDIRIRAQQHDEITFCCVFGDQFRAGKGVSPLAGGMRCGD